MIFRVVDSRSAASSEDEILLVIDNWNDWFTWHTMFTVVVVRQGERITAGSVKIGQKGMVENESATTQLPAKFSQLDNSYFSVGQSENYYETLNSIGAEFRSEVLSALRDCAQNLFILDENQNESVLGRSLLRDIDQKRVRNRFHRLANGNVALSNYAFKYTYPEDELSSVETLELTFEVTSNSYPPSNVHAIIGRNGVGKTRCFDFLSRSFIGVNGPDGEEVGEVSALDPDPFGESVHSFAGLVTVSFSPFDKYGPLANSSQLDVRYSYVGLIKVDSQDSQSASGESAVTASLAIKTIENLAEDFISSVGACRQGARRERWARALKVLEADPLFEEANVSAIAAETEDAWKRRARKVWSRLSSGHSVVLLTVTKLVELVEEKSLVLIDEPEGHLHPPLLSAFVRALSDLLIERNGVAIIATHSPVVLQEVRKDCVWILNRSGHEARADRPELETLGENVGVLTREVFGLEVMRTGFHRMIMDAVSEGSYEAIIAKFDGHLGAEARSLARAILLNPGQGDSVAEEDE